MIKHYFIVAFRSLLKYRQQTIISIVGLTVGFVCFALSAYWIRYELSFDNFHAEGDRIYQVRQIGERFQISDKTPPILAKSLETNFPGVKATYVGPTSFRFGPNEEDIRTRGLEVDHRFFEVFDVELLQGSFDKNDEFGVLVTESFARKHFQTDYPVGKELIEYMEGEEYERYRVRGVVKDWPRNTNLPFDIIKPLNPRDLGMGAPQWWWTYLWAEKSVDPDELQQRLSQFQIPELLDGKSTYTLLPLRAVYYTEPVSHDSALKFDQVVLFAVLGLLVVLSSLFNYLNLYASRIRMRTRELSLRKVSGASDLQIFGLLIIEFGMLLSAAFIVGFVCIEWILPWFKTFADIDSDSVSIYGELLLYVLLLVVISLLGAAFVVFYVRRRLFQESLRQVSTAKPGGLFFRTGLLLQMVIGVVVIFCTVVYFKQIYTLNTAYSGIVRDNILSVELRDGNRSGYNNNKIPVLVDALRGESSIDTVMSVGSGSIFPRVFSGQEYVAKKNEAITDDEAVKIENFRVYPGYLSFYGLQLLAGQDFKPNIFENRGNVILNEAAVKALGLTDPIGKVFCLDMAPYYTPDGRIGKYSYALEHCTVIGVVKDFVYDSPLVPVAPVVIQCSNFCLAIAVRHKPGQFQEAKESIERLVKERCPEFEPYISVVDQVYRSKYEKESSLQFLLALLSGVCIVVSLFGIYSMVSLSSEQRRKEMAVRKVNGASLLSIFGLFLKEYIIMLFISVLVAFPVGYLVMKPWTEKFVLQTSIGIWLYASFFLSVALVIVVTVLGRIWHTTHVNPVLELKKE